MLSATRARAHALVASYPTGGERSAATDVLKVNDDLQLIWDYQFQSPTGAFFDASTDNLLAAMKDYPEYQKFIADKTFTDANGTRFYPTHETRDFLVRETASRLKRAGVSMKAAPPTVARISKPTTVMPKKPTKPPIAAVAPKTRKPSGRTSAPPVQRRASAGVTPKKAKPTQVAAISPKKRRISVEQTTTKPVTAPKPAPQPVAPAPAPARTPSPAPPTAAPVPAVPTVTVTPPPLATTTQPATTSPTQTPAMQTTATGTTATGTTVTQTTATGTTPTSETTASAAEKPVETSTRSESRHSLILPLILIVAGVGVLILLFRTSS